MEVDAVLTSLPAAVYHYSPEWSALTYFNGPSDWTVEYVQKRTSISQVCGKLRSALATIHRSTALCNYWLQYERFSAPHAKFCCYQGTYWCSPQKWILEDWDASCVSSLDLSLYLKRKKLTNPDNNENWWPYALVPYWGPFVMTVKIVEWSSGCRVIFTFTTLLMLLLLLWLLEAYVARWTFPLVSSIKCIGAPKVELWFVAFKATSPYCENSQA